MGPIILYMTFSGKADWKIFSQWVVSDMQLKNKEGPSQHSKLPARVCCPASVQHVTNPGLTDCGTLGYCKIAKRQGSVSVFCASLINSTGKFSHFHLFYHAQFHMLRQQTCLTADRDMLETKFIIRRPIGFLCYLTKILEYKNNCFHTRLLNYITV